MRPLERVIVAAAVVVIAVLAGVFLILAPNPADSANEWFKRLSVCVGVFMIAAGIYMGARLIPGPDRNQPSGRDDEEPAGEQ